jgi:hypothetical protein
VGVVVVVVGADGFEWGRGGAAVGGFAAADLELDGGVGDVEAVAQGAVDAFEDLGALGDGHLGDGDMAGQGVGGGAERPAVEVVDIEHAGNLAEGGADVGQRDGGGGAFEQDVERLADDGDRGPQDHAGDDEGEDGVDPHLAGEEDDDAADDDGSGGERVAEHVEEDRAYVDVAGELPEQGGDGAIHEDASGGDVHHKAGLDGDGGVEAMDGGERDPGGEDDEGEGVDEGGEDSGALVAECLLIGGGAALEVDGDEGERDGEHVRDVVAGFGDEGEGVGADAEVKSGEDVEARGAERDDEHALHFAVGCSDHVHDLSIRGATRKSKAVARGAKTHPFAVRLRKDGPPGAVAAIYWKLP